MSNLLCDPIGNSYYYNLDISSQWLCLKDGQHEDFMIFYPYLLIRH